ncbi:zinc finger SWIM domain-containing protein 7 isoform X2 [Gopherus evgoodei]|uniref:zinc finger SWIM domain-containing protein 7 isoform X2 n=1 Tax=Gopherus evgoodei TaxID=1825980 RepID=UPI0011CEFEBE|nr:zinc finger SWIM domain-containing protein 7 isoform X2 [Gopherus evgoodei]
MSQHAVRPSLSQHAVRPGCNPSPPSMPCGPAVTCPLPAWPEAQQRGTSPPSVRAAPPPEEPRPSTLCGPAERQTSYQIGNPNIPAYCAALQRGGKPCLIPPLPSGKVQQSSLTLEQLRQVATCGELPEVQLSVEEDGGHFACSSRGAFERDKKGFPGDLAWLKFVFGSSAVAALDLVDQHSVTRIVSPSGRAVYQEDKTFNISGVVLGVGPVSSNWADLKEIRMETGAIGCDFCEAWTTIIV